jgi:hypothetical protein
MPKIKVSLPQRARLRGVCVACALGDATSFILNMIVRPCRSTLSLDPEALEGRLSKGGSRREAIDG